ncbi:MAG: beta-ketoacyl-ACP synthase II [candidate division Zixibacteria bacterium]|nr:beta-ketoacyl-ACP synthase II [candidate division Zixibacteria bacterium]
MGIRTVVTGMGAVTPLGNSVDELWQALLRGESGADLITRFDASAYTTRIAAEVKNFDPLKYFEKKELKRTDLSQQYAIAASQQAVDDSGLKLDNVDPDRAGVIIGAGVGGIETFEEQVGKLLSSGPGRVSPFFIPMMIIDMCAGLVSMRFNFRGPNYAVVSACASSSHALLDAYYVIQRGEADIMVAGGAEAAITPSSMAGFCQAKAMSTRNDEPKKASRPFDKGRDGFVMGEGAGIMVLESYDHAVKRGARIYGEIVGAGMTCDAYHITAPHPDGLGAKQAMRMALQHAGLQPTQIDHINTHGTATGLGDIAETRAIKAVFGEHAYKIPCNSTKSMIGHLLGAAGATELVTVFKAMESGIVHPTINLDDPDPECDLDYVPNHARECRVNFAVSNSFGFGGHNVSLVVGRVNSAQ